MGNDANGIVACVKLKFFHLEGGGLNHQRDYQSVRQKFMRQSCVEGTGFGLNGRKEGACSQLQ
jgi:hypothetical protein